MLTEAMAYLIVYGGLLAAAAVGLSLHIRLVRFFDLTWALWVIASSLVAVWVGQSFGLVTAIILGALLSCAAAVIEDAILLHSLLVTQVKREALERLIFVAALGAYLAIMSSSELAGFRGQEILPATGPKLIGLSVSEFWSALFCWTALLVCGGVRKTYLGLRLRALLDNSVAMRVFGFNVRFHAAIIAAIAGTLTGLAASCFGVLYRAHNSVGLSVMLAAVVPCLIVGMRSSVRVLFAAWMTAGLVALIRFWLGYSTAEILVQVAVVLLLLFFPEGLSGRRLRTV